MNTFVYTLGVYDAHIYTLRSPSLIIVRAHFVNKGSLCIGGWYHIILQFTKRSDTLKGLVTVKDTTFLILGLVTILLEIESDINF